MIGVAGALLIALVLPAAAAAQELRAEAITPENAAELLIGGPDAIGGVGDVYLANDLVEAVIDHPSRRHAKLNHGGTLVDLGLRDRGGEDQFARLIPLVNLSQRVVVGYDAIRSELDGEAARVVVTSPGLRAIPRGGGLARALDPLVPETAEIENVRVETRYELRPGEPFLRITTVFENSGDTRAPVFAFGDLWMRGGRSLRAFLGNAVHPELARGFHHVSFSRQSVLSSSLDALAPFSHVVTPGLPAFPPIAYALFSPERSRAGRSFFGVTGEHVTLAMALRADPGWRELGLLDLVRALRGGLEPGETWQVERRVLVTGASDVGSATDVIHRELEVVTGDTGLVGRVVPPDVRSVVHVQTPDGVWVTQVESREGVYRASLPPGRYRLTVLAEHRSGVVLEVQVTDGARAVVPDIEWEPLGTLVFAPAFADGGPGSIVFQGRHGRPDPIFAPELLDFRLDDHLAPTATDTSAIHFMGNDRDPTRVQVPVGRYQLFASRGLEHDVDTRVVQVAADTPLRVEPFDLPRVAALPEHVSADFHVHAQASDDSGTTNEARLREFVAAGIEVLVATDHDHVPDYDGALLDLGLVGRIRVVRGVEVTSSTPSSATPWTIGHHNAWPVPFQPWAHRRGAPPSQELRLGALYGLLRSELGAEVVQLNHPRGKGSGLQVGSFFTHQGALGAAVDPRLPITAQRNASLLQPAEDGTRAVDFDVIETMNGDAFHQYLETRDDLHWLLRQGYRRAATANSDTHGPDELAGMPRNYVRVGDRFDDTRQLHAALRDGRSFGTTGPLITRFAANGARAGETVAPEGGRLRVEYEVVSAPWVEVDEVRLLVNGEVVRVTDALAGELELEPARDAFVTLEAGVPLDVDPERWIRRHPGPYTDAIAPGFVPVAFSNPIYVDADGDGRWLPPGLPPRQGSWNAWLLGGAAVLALGALLARFRVP